MLNEQKARSCVHDAAKRTARIEVKAGEGRAREVAGTVLTDARGQVVGVDVEPDSPERIVVMVGRHEDVTTTKRVRISVTRNAAGEVLSVVLRDLDAPK